MSIRKQVAVIGSARSSENMYSTAFEIGKLLAQKKHIVITGGRSGIMEAVAKGVHSLDGISIGILPDGDGSDANDYNLINIPTGMGYTRNALNILAADIVIAIGGSAGTLNEISYAWMYKKPIFAYVGHGGWSEKLAGTSLDDRRSDRIQGFQSLEELTDLIANA